MLQLLFCPEEGELCWEAGVSQQNGLQLITGGRQLTDGAFSGNGHGLQ